MSDLTYAFEDMPLIHVAGMKAAYVDGAVDVNLRGFYQRGLWDIESIRLNGDQGTKGSFRTLTAEDEAHLDQFMTVASAVMVEIGEEIEKRLADLYGKPSAYDRGRNQMEAA